VAESMFDDLFDSTFEVMGCDQAMHELVPNGRNMKVSWQNRKQFIDALRAYRLNEFHTQCAAVKRGLASVVLLRFFPCLRGAN